MNCTNVSLGQPPKAIEIKVKISKWDIIKLKTIYTAVENINKHKKTTSRLKIFANDVTKQGLNFQNIQTAPMIQQQQQQQQANQTLDRRPKSTFLQRGNTHGQ